MNLNNISADDKLLRIRREILLLKGKIVKTEEFIVKMDTKLAELSAYLQAIGKGDHIPDKVFVAFNVLRGSPWQEKTLLKTRISGMIEQTKTEKRSAERNIKAMRETLESLYVCPDCGGSGILYRKKKYDRLEGGQIFVTSDRDTCSFCGGKGRLTFLIC